MGRMGIDKLCEMVNSEKAMSYSFGEMLTQYMKAVTSEQGVNDAVDRGAVSDALSDDRLSYDEVTTCSQLAMTKDHWVEMGGDAGGEGAITKNAFIQAMKRFCSNVQVCKDALDGHFELRRNNPKEHPLILGFDAADYFHYCRTSKNPDKVAACIREKTEAKNTDVYECLKK